MLSWSPVAGSRKHELRIVAAPLSDGWAGIDLSSDEGESTSDVQLPFGPADVDAAVATATRQTEQSIARSQQELPSDPLRELGRRLFDLVFAGRGKVLYDRCRERARESGAGVRIRVVLPRTTDGRDVRWLPWEFLYDSRRGDFLALSVLSPLVRDAAPPPRAVMPLVGPPLRVLVVTADVTGAFGADAEVKKLRSIAARNRQRLRLTVLTDATAPEMLNAVRKRDYDVLHFIGTGLPGDAPGVGLPARAGLLLMPENREPITSGRYLTEQVVAASDLLAAVVANEGVRLVVLDACHTDEVAARLAESVQAVVGVRGRISIVACTVFAFELYRAVARGEPLDTAVTVARRQVDHRLTGSREWGLQTFYLQTADGEFAHWPRAGVWKARGATVGDALEAGRALSDEKRKAALVRAILGRNQEAIADLIDRADGEVPEVVREQLRTIKARLKSL
jgi:hypothetical protein